MLHGDAAVKSKFQALVGRMKASFHPLRVKNFADASYENYRNEDDVWTSQFDRFKSEATSLFTEALDNAIEMKRQWREDGCGVGLPGDVLAEMLHHYEWARKKCDGFHGRLGLVSSAMDKILQRVAVVPGEVSGHYGCISLAVVGVSGSGKTALMSKLAEEMSRSTFPANADTAANTQIPVIIRFCGTSPGSVTGLALVQSIVHQMQYLMGKPFDDNRVSGMSFGQLVPYFHHQLSAFPVFLFIDSLDQLADDDQARSQISFLRDCNPRPHPDGRIVVSTLPDDDLKEVAAYAKWSREIEQQQQQQQQQNQQLVKTNFVSVSGTNGNSNNDHEPRRSDSVVPMYFYGCESQLRAAGECVPRVDVMMECVDGVGLVKTVLEKEKCRTLTSAQWEIVSEGVSKEPTALYLQLAVRVVQGWSSHLDVDAGVDAGVEVGGDGGRGQEVVPKLAGGVRNLIYQILETIELNFGLLLVRAALSFVTFSVQGISDNEMIDLLSLDGQVMSLGDDGVNQYNVAARLPPHVWYRLRSELAELLASQGDGCLSWYHRQLKEAAEARYESKRKYYHGIMARYFGDLVEESVRHERRVNRQPLVFNSRTSDSNFNGKYEETTSLSVWRDEAAIMILPGRVPIFQAIIPNSF
jgi:hypothetical protein